MYNLIGVYGLNERSKQDTLAEAIQEHYGYINYRISALPELMIGHVLQALGYSTRRINTLFQNTSLDSAIPELGISLKRLAKTLEINWGIENVKYDFWERCAVAYMSHPAWL